MGIVRSSIVVSVLSLAISIVSFFNQMFLANYFGAGKQMDIYLCVSSFPLLISAMITAGLSYSLTPFLLTAKVRLGANYSDFVGRFFIKLCSYSILLVLFLIIATFLIVDNYYGLLFNVNERVVVSICILSSFTVFFNILISFFNSIFNAEKKFRTPVILSALPYVSTVIISGFFHYSLGSISISLGLFLGAAISCLVAYKLLFKQVTFNFLKVEFVEDIVKFFSKIPSIAVAMLCFSVYQTIDSFWAPRLGIANLSYLGYCQRLIIAFGALVITGPSTVLLPRLTLANIEGRRLELLQDTLFVLKTIIALASLVALIISLLANDIVKILFERGEFNSDDTAGVSSVLPIMLIGMIFMLCVVMLFRVFFTVETKKHILLIGILSSLCYFLFSGVGSYFLGIRGIAYAYVLDWLIVLFFSIYIIFNKYLELIFNIENLKFLFRQCILLIFVFLSIKAAKFFLSQFLSNYNYGQNVLSVSVMGCVGILLYFLLSCTLIRQSEIVFLLKRIFDNTPVQNKFLTALAKIGPMSYLPFTTTKPKAYVKNNSTCPNDSTVASRKVQKIGK